MLEIKTMYLLQYSLACFQKLKALYNKQKHKVVFTVKAHSSPVTNTFI